MAGVPLPALRVPSSAEWRADPDDVDDELEEFDEDEDDLDDEELEDEDDLDDEELEEDDEPDEDVEEEPVDDEADVADTGQSEAQARHRMLELLGVELRALHPTSNPSPGRQVISQAGSHRFKLPIGATILADGLILFQGRKMTRHEATQLYHQQNPDRVPATPVKAAKKAAAPKAAAPKKLTPAQAERELNSAEDWAQAARDGRVSKPMAAKQIREMADGQANSAGITRSFEGEISPITGKPRVLTTEELQRVHSQEAEAARLRALADEIEARPAKATKAAPAKKAAPRIAQVNDPPTALDKAIRRRYESGESLTQIGKAEGVSATLAHTSLTRQGVQLRPRGGVKPAAAKASPASGFNPEDYARRINDIPWQAGEAGAAQHRLEIAAALADLDASQLRRVATAITLPIPAKRAGGGTWTRENLRQFIAENIVRDRTRWSLGGLPPTMEEAAIRDRRRQGIAAGLTPKHADAYARSGLTVDEYKAAGLSLTEAMDFVKSGKSWADWRGVVPNGEHAYGNDAPHTPAPRLRDLPRLSDAALEAGRQVLREIGISFNEANILQALQGYNPAELLRIADAANITFPSGARTAAQRRLHIAQSMAANNSRRFGGLGGRSSDAATEERLAGQDVTPGHDELHHYWVAGPGLAKWVHSPKPWTTLHALVTEAVRKNGRAVTPEQINNWVSRWFIEVFHYAAGSDKNRVAHGMPPRGHRVGPG
jgi:hypothetical protein